MLKNDVEGEKKLELIDSEEIIRITGFVLRRKSEIQCENPIFAKGILRGRREGRK